MDAATLYMIVTLPNGEQRTSTQKFPTLEACDAQVELLRTVEPLDRQSPIASYRCGGHNPFAFVAHFRRGRSRRLLELSSRQACTHAGTRAERIAIGMDGGEGRKAHAVEWRACTVMLITTRSGSSTLPS